MKCPMCANGTIVKLVIKNYKTKMGGKPIIVPKANIEECDTCKERLYHAKEIRRWERIAKGK